MPTAAYDEIADWYDRAVRDGTLLHPAILTDTLFDLLGDLHGRVVLDLGCGQGVLSREMARRGAVVTGIDLSAGMLANARRDEDARPLGIDYRQGDAQNLAGVADAAFTGIVCVMALMDIPDLQATLGSAARVLRPGSWLVFVVTHPCFQTPPGAAYHAEGFWRSDNPHGVRGKVGAHHRTLSTYLNAAIDAGLRLARLEEPPMPGRDVPALLFARCEKPA